MLLRKKKIVILLSFLFFLLILFVFYENLNFYYGKKKILDNNFFINEDGFNNLKFYKNFINLNYDHFIGFTTSINNYLFYYLLGKNILAIFLFNILTYTYIIYSFLKYFKNENKKIFILIFAIFNFKIISLLNFPTKDINNFFSLLFLFMFYVEKRYFFLFCSILLAFFSRNISLCIVFLIILINSNFFKSLNAYFKKKIILISCLLYLIFTILHLFYKYKFIIFLNEIPLFSFYLYFLKINIFNFKSFFSYLLHIFVFRSILKLFIKEKVKEINFHISFISLIIIIITQAITNQDYVYSHFELIRKGNIGLESNFSITHIIDEYSKNGYFFIIYPIKIFLLLFAEILKPNRFTIDTLTQFSVFIFLIYTIFKKRFIINSKIFFIFFIPLLIYSMTGHLSSRVILYAYPTILIYFLMHKKIN
jgi:hypothetical protein